MNTILQFMFADIWHFFGCQLAFVTVCKGIAIAVNAVDKVASKPKPIGPTEREVLMFRAGMQYQSEITQRAAVYYARQFVHEDFAKEIEDLVKETKERMLQ